MTPNVSSKSSILKKYKVQTWDLKYEIKFNKYSLCIEHLKNMGSLITQRQNLAF